MCRSLHSLRGMGEDILLSRGLDPEGVKAVETKGRMGGMYYKILGDCGKPHLGGGAWHLPKGNRPGKWMPKIEALSMCNSGYHVTDAAHVIDFLDYGYHVYEVEVRGECLAEANKSCHQQARLLRELQWGEREARLFACDCAERALDLWARTGTVDPRSRAAVEVARRFANGEAKIGRASCRERVCQYV